MKKLIAVLIMSCVLGTASLSCAADDWSKTDKQLFAMTIGSQILDYLSTGYFLNENQNNYIAHTWAWKYSTNRPSPEQLALVKGGELLICYLVADKLGKYRKHFLIGVNSLLLGCANYNFGKFGFGFRATW
ncbi:MAG: hypothetical protein SVW57_08535 [Thermodesulfobacteriota bacterium]|nr:hypothetical protein [Thermodesulfobacteriota bacterium]